MAELKYSEDIIKSLQSSMKKTWQNKKFMLYYN
jgi:hypothetical protein